MSRKLTRRTFAKSLAAIAAAPVAPTVAAAEPQPAPPAPPTSTAMQADGTNQDALALAQVVNNRWGDRLTPEELAQVIQNIDGGLKRAAELYRIPLLNSDAPDFVFTPYRSGG